MKTSKKSQEWGDERVENVLRASGAQAKELDSKARARVAASLLAENDALQNAKKRPTVAGRLKNFLRPRGVKNKNRLKVQ